MGKRRLRCALCQILNEAMNLYVGKLLTGSELIVATANGCDGISTPDLAWLAHECERHEDDISMGNICTASDRPEFRETYRRLWTQHAQLCGYAKTR